MRVPIALHSDLSAMTLLHTIPPALMITETGPARYVTNRIHRRALLDEYRETSYGHVKPENDQV